MWIVYILIGTISGIISGMGIGGGAVLIPAVTFIFGTEQRSAQFLNLIYFVPTAVIALIVHIKKGNIRKDGLLPLIIFGVMGGIAGSYAAVMLDSAILKKGFGGFLLIMGVMEFFKKEKKENTNGQS